MTGHAWAGFPPVGGQPGFEALRALVEATLRGRVGAREWSDWAGSGPGAGRARSGRRGAGDDPWAEATRDDSPWAGHGTGHTGHAGHGGHGRGRGQGWGPGKGGPRGWGGPPWTWGAAPWGSSPFDVFGPGAPGGPGGRGRGRRRGPRGRGDVRLAIVGLLAEEPMHGYQLIQEITARSEGRWRPSPGSVYPTLAQLEDEALVRAEEADGRRVFRLTQAGEALAADRAGEFAALWHDDEAEPIGPGLRQLGEVLVQVGGAAVQVATAGSEAQRRAAAEVLERARRDLYLLLAEEADEGEADDDDVEGGTAGESQGSDGSESTRNEP